MFFPFRIRDPKSYPLFRHPGSYQKLICWELEFLAQMWPHSLTTTWDENDVNSAICLHKTTSNVRSRDLHDFGMSYLSPNKIYEQRESAGPLQAAHTKGSAQWSYQSSSSTWQYISKKYTCLWTKKNQHIHGKLKCLWKSVQNVFATKFLRLKYVRH